MIPRRVRLTVWLGAALHGFLILLARYRLSYDAYNHMFFGDHYRLNWWSLWEPRWYTGFEVTSYPPLVHQIIGLLGRWIGVDAGFALLLWVVLSAYPLAVYGFCRIFTGKTVAGYAAMGVALLSSVYQAAHTFGQLPTLMGTLFALFAMIVLKDFLLTGNKLSASLAVVLIGVVMAAHHATLLFLPWALGAVCLHLLLNRKSLGSEQKLETPVLFRRLFIFVFCATLIGLLVIWPFWLWGLGQSMQTPIDHPSRHNFFSDPFAPMAFFLPVYGALIPLIPFVFWKGFQRKYLGLGVSFSALFILGLGGTTPLPRLIFGSGWAWLTYDRFALWASLLMLPFFGVAMIIVRRKLPSFFARKLRTKLTVNISGFRLNLTKLAFGTLCVTAIVSGLLPTLLPTQPAPVNMQPIVDFLARGNHSKWRYVTFGLGDQFAYLSLLTKATTIDGSYHTARGLPELRASGVGQIDTAYWLPGGLNMLDPILQKSGKRGVRWGFLNRADYIPILERNGWIQRGILSNGIQVWENPQAILPPPVIPPAESRLEIFSWGVFPLFTLCMALVLSGLWLRPALTRRFLLFVHSLSIGLLPLALCFWYYIEVTVNERARVYFTYTNGLFFVSDALCLAAVLAWLLVYIFVPTHEMLNDRSLVVSRFNLWNLLASPTVWFFGITLLASVSCLWSRDWRVSLVVSLHLWLVFGLFLSLRERASTWRAFVAGSVVALLVQVALGFGEVILQSTAFLAPLGLNWPGSLQPSVTGASIVPLLNGQAWLRAYGSLPHPNILGGLVFVFIAAACALYLNNTRYPRLTLSVIGLGLVLLILTFSRSAWLAFAVFAVILAARYRSFSFKRYSVLAVIGLISLVLVSMPLWNLIFMRTGGISSAPTEEFSINARLWLMQASQQMIREFPWTGVGVGAYILELAQRAAYGYIIEPVHNIPLLVVSELGLPGGLLFLGLVYSILMGALRATQPLAVVFSALVVGLGVIAMFDHYLWSLGPGRVLVGLTFGLLVGQFNKVQGIS